MNHRGWSARFGLGTTNRPPPVTGRRNSRISQATEGRKEGRDPQEERHSVREAPTVAEFAERFLREHVSLKKSSTRRNTTLLLREHVIPAIGRKKLGATPGVYIQECCLNVLLPRLGSRLTSPRLPPDTLSSPVHHAAPERGNLDVPSPSRLFSWLFDARSGTTLQGGRMSKVLILNGADDRI